MQIGGRVEYVRRKVVQEKDWAEQIERTRQKCREKENTNFIVEGNEVVRDPWDLISAVGPGEI